MSIDMRGFAYPLEPLLRRRRWQLDAMQMELGKLQQHIDARQRAADDLCEQQHLAQSWHAAPSPGVPFDPVAHARSLRWLVHLRTLRAGLDAELADLRGDRSTLIGQCRVQQHKVEAIEAHREESAAEFSTRESTRLAREADRDWLSRGAVVPMRRSSPAESSV